MEISVDRIMRNKRRGLHGNAVSLTRNKDELLLEDIYWPLFLLGPVLHGIDPFLRKRRVEMGSKNVDVRNI